MAYESTAWELFQDVKKRGGDTWATRLDADLKSRQDDGADVDKLMPQAFIYIAKAFVSGKRTGAQFSALLATQEGKKFDPVVQLDGACADKGLFAQKMGAITVKHFDVETPLTLHILRAYFGMKVFHDGIVIGTAKFAGSEREFREALASMDVKQRKAAPKTAQSDTGSLGSAQRSGSVGGTKCSSEQSENTDSSTEKAMLNALQTNASRMLNRIEQVNTMTDQVVKVKAADKINKVLAVSKYVAGLMQIQQDPDTQKITFGPAGTKLVENKKVSKKTLGKYCTAVDSLITAYAALSNKGSTPYTITGDEIAAEIAQAEGVGRFPDRLSPGAKVILAIVHQTSVGEIATAFGLSYGAVGPVAPAKCRFDLGTLSGSDDE